MTEQATQLRDQLIAASDRMKAVVAQLDQLRRQFEHARVTAQSELTAQTRQTIERMRAEITVQINQSVAQSKAAVEHDLAERREALVFVVSYLEHLQASQRDFESWLIKLKACSRLSCEPNPSSTGMAGASPVKPSWPNSRGPSISHFPVSMWLLLSPYRTRIDCLACRSFLIFLRFQILMQRFHKRQWLCQESSAGKNVRLPGATSP
jgi:hypothetical protein